MSHHLLLKTEINILVLLLVASLAAIALKKVKFPDTVGLVVMGIILSAQQLEKHKQRQLQGDPGIGRTAYRLANGAAWKTNSPHSLKQEILREGISANEYKFMANIGGFQSRESWVSA